MRVLSFCLTLFIIASLTGDIIRAQDVCPTLERAAIAETSVWCTAMDVGEVCYGNAQVELETHSETEVEANAWRNVGDVVDLAPISAIEGRIDTASRT